MSTGRDTLNFYAKPEEDLTDRYRNLFKFFGMSDAADDIVSASRITRNAHTNRENQSTQR